MRVQVRLARQTSLEHKLIRLPAATTERGPAFLGAGVRFGFAAATVLCEVLGPWARLRDVRGGEGASCEAERGGVCEGGRGCEC